MMIFLFMIKITPYPNIQVLFISNDQFNSTHFPKLSSDAIFQFGKEILVLCGKPVCGFRPVSHKSSLMCTGRWYSKNKKIVVYRLDLTCWVLGPNFYDHFAYVWHGELLLHYNLITWGFFCFENNRSGDVVYSCIQCLWFSYMSD